LSVIREEVRSTRRPANDPKVKALVYGAAFAPNVGVSINDLALLGWLGNIRRQFFELS
jgi:hypothetical protein